MSPVESLNGVDHWEDSIGQAWAKQWSRAHICNERYRWNVLATELYRSAITMNCERQRFLAGIARLRAVEAVNYSAA